jgi:hypothetical protein
MTNKEVHVMQIFVNAVQDTTYVDDPDPRHRIITQCDG